MSSCEKHTIKPPEFQGLHILGELEANEKILDDLHELSNLLSDSLADAEATVLKIVGKKFDPVGATVIAMLSESHASLHTYPEHGLAFFDLFTCGMGDKSLIALDSLVRRMEAKIVKQQIIKRGFLI